MNISITELSTLNLIISDYDDRIEVVEVLLGDILGDLQKGDTDSYELADDILVDLEVFHDSRLLLLRLLNESKLKV